MIIRGERTASRRKHLLVRQRDSARACNGWQTDIESARALLAAWIVKAIDEKWGTAVAAEHATGVSQTEFSRIRNGKLGRFTVDRLVHLLNVLDNDIEAHLSVEVLRRKSINLTRSET